MNCSACEAIDQARNVAFFQSEKRKLNSDNLSRNDKVHVNIIFQDGVHQTDKV